MAALIDKANSTSLTNVDVLNAKTSGTEGIGGVIGQTGSDDTTLNEVNLINSDGYSVEATNVMLVD